MAAEPTARDRSSVVLVTEFLRAFERFDFAAQLQLMADGIRLRLPTAPSGLPREVLGCDAVGRFLEEVAQVWPRFSLARCEVHAFADDPGRVVASYASDAENVDGTPYRNSYLALASVEDGKIATFEEFFDPAPMSEALTKCIAAQCASS
ncbi:nuclear transport factor 2 family protein [Mycobacterium vicinigordonae]|uniref:Nuclear transport factor 2 family protein n=1 Tax=Mycobacterium vicinigordonae TaxID=1719132 RepID=A0A7D6I7A9_9MYCO|nr:nuclear transport factor 2 family protein [Mycobacterium vicinigordonae]QLL06357.1 nuclear transport factor 2 family protein [Mycobacterium vicinigordonae]